MRRLLALVLLLAPIASAKLPLDEFRARRASLRKSLDGVLLLVARPEGADEVFRSDQEPNFYYLTGHNEEGAGLIILPAPKSGASSATSGIPQETLFLPPKNSANLACTSGLPAT